GDALNETAMRSNFRKHNTYVRSTLAGTKTQNGLDRLLVYDVREGWEPLCRFLGREPPAWEFPEVSPEMFDDSAPLLMVESVIEEADAPDGQDEVCKFGMLMRQELRRGLVAGTVVLTSFVIMAFAMHMRDVVEIPLVMLSLVYVVLITVGWNTYVVMHRLVMQVPALVVLPYAMKSLCIATMLHACFISYGVLKESLVTRHQVAPLLLVLSGRVVSVLLGSGFLLLTKGQLSLGLPLPQFMAFAISNEMSTFAGYEMLKYLSFP
ncbi:unnamed protein product, partial [Polarella glacialis]